MVPIKELFYPPRLRSAEFGDFLERAPFLTTSQDTMTLFLGKSTWLEALGGSSLVVWRLVSMGTS